MIDKSLHPSVLKDSIDRLAAAHSRHWVRAKELAKMASLHSSRIADLESLEEDLHNYVRGLEDKVNTNNKLAFDAINTAMMRFEELSARVEKLESKDPLDELIDDAVKKEPSFYELVFGTEEPFHKRLREGCQFTKEELPPEKLASVLRFVAVEVSRMTERDMGGSFTISNLKVSERLRELADEAAVEDFNGSDGPEEDEGPGWGMYGYEHDEEDFGK